MTTSNNTQLVVERTKIDVSNVQSGSINTDHPTCDNAVVLKVVKFAFTANNVTYAAVGNSYHYFDFFPPLVGGSGGGGGDQKDDGEEPKYGSMPVWGIGEVMASRHADIAVSTRVYGYFPPAKYCEFVVYQCTKHGFSVNRPWVRMESSGVYNSYTFINSDAMYLKPSLEDHMIVYRPLFTTAVMLHDYIRQLHSTVDVVCVSSASAKTSMCLAYLLKRTVGRTCSVVGLTSPRNIQFVRSMDVYDTVLPYGEVATMSPQATTLVVDIAGSSSVQRDLATHLGANLIKCLIVGMSHWTEVAAAAPSDGGNDAPMATEVFFAPAWYQRRSVELGTAEISKRLVQAWALCMERARTWVSMRHGCGDEAVMHAYTQLLAGACPPNEAYVMTMHAKL